MAFTKEQQREYQATLRGVLDLLRTEDPEYFDKLLNRSQRSVAVKNGAHERLSARGHDGFAVVTIFGPERRPDASFSDGLKLTPRAETHVFSDPGAHRITAPKWASGYIAFGKGADGGAGISGSPGQAGRHSPLNGAVQWGQTLVVQVGRGGADATLDEGNGGDGEPTVLTVEGAAKE